ncbi:hypothetical protein D1646_08045 [Pseudoflavonifractor sp. 60]|uniref:GerMN domain-containing protein n=1 Tax=Pseudoflavonifractor sp. 60 TaxID=2304576 RepID=UPI0013714087|nr:GerMN domain-containing protein [Pseudoflavonifractor sp. 60]NBI66768.1 hypothetical protein [Pseudoflavonifractor sp. 60]
MKAYLCLLAALALVLAACGTQEKQAAAEGVQLWFAVDARQPDYGHGPALACEPYQPPESQIGTPEGESDPNPGALLEALMNGPKDPELTSPFPRGLTFQWWEWDPDNPGTLRVGMSEQYGGLTDISLTLADYCIVLTLSQLEGVETVEITARGRQVSYRSHQVLSAEEAVLWDELAGETAAP